MFDFVNCTEDEVVQHFYNSSRQSIEQVIVRYKAKGMVAVVEKLQRAKVLAKVKKMMEKI